MYVMKPESLNSRQRRLHGPFIKHTTNTSHCPVSKPRKVRWSNRTIHGPQRELWLCPYVHCCIYDWNMHRVIAYSSRTGCFPRNLSGKNARPLNRQAYCRPALQWYCPFSRLAFFVSNFVGSILELYASRPTYNPTLEQDVDGVYILRAGKMRTCGRADLRIFGPENDET